MWQQYYFPDSFEEAARLLNAHKVYGRIIAGGTDLMVEFRNGIHKDLTTLIDITRIPDTGKIWVDDHDIIHLDANVCHSDVVASELLQKHAHILVGACRTVGSPQIRNRGTVAGNLITASPANDAITPLMALDSEVVLLSVSGERVVPLSAFYKGVRRTVMQPNELLTQIRFPMPKPTDRAAFRKIGLRKAHAISLINCGMNLSINDSVITRASITLGSVAPVIVHAKEAEQYLTGKNLTDINVDQVCRLAQQSVSPISDIRSSQAYREEMTAVLVRQCLEDCFSESPSSDISEKSVVLWGGQQNPLHKAKVQETISGQIHCTINHKNFAGTYEPGTTLLQFLRDNALLTGTKEGCGEGECGACTIFMDGAAVLACLIPAERAHGATITTIEGLQQEGILTPVQQAFVDEGAVQCGFCTPGFVMSATKLLEEIASPSSDQIREAISGNLCRCTGYYTIIKAIEKAAESFKKEV
jgi:xanthine dehydrogenase iron-sulfur cluster and FAD-binding subunit A